VIAPVTGVLHSPAGVLVGSVVMSVQDDLGFAKLERRFVGDPIGIYVHGRLIVERGGSFPKTAPPTRAGVTLSDVVYGAVTRTYNAFPIGTVNPVLAIPTPTTAVAEQACAAVTVGEIGRVAKRITTLFQPTLAAHYAAVVEVVSSITGATVIVRIGPRAITGSDGPGPPTLPPTGTVSYLGRTWSVFSFAPTPPARIYVLVPTPAPSPATPSAAATA
jgi:hypothetical protein